MVITHLSIDNDVFRYVSSFAKALIVIGSVLVIINLWVNAFFITNRMQGTPIMQVATFNKTEYKTITNTVTNTIYKEKFNWYLETGINSIDSKIAPYVGIRLTMPNNFGIGGNIGVFDNKAFYGFSINYKIK